MLWGYGEEMLYGFAMSQSFLKFQSPTKKWFTCAFLFKKCNCTFLPEKWIWTDLQFSLKYSCTFLKLLQLKKNHWVFIDYKNSSAVSTSLIDYITIPCMHIKWSCWTSNTQHVLLNWIIWNSHSCRNDSFLFCMLLSGCWDSSTSDARSLALDTTCRMGDWPDGENCSYVLLLCIVTLLKSLDNLTNFTHTILLETSQQNINFV
jgi:hypothetical protein